MYNPSRRSRKIGQTQGGRVRDGKAREKWSRAFPQTIWRQLSEAPGEGYAVLSENPSRDHYHPCSPAQIRNVLSRLPRRYTRDLRAVILRRVPRADRERGVEARRETRCIVLNAFPITNEIDWGTAPPAWRSSIGFEMLDETLVRSPFQAMSAGMNAMTDAANIAARATVR